MYPKPSTLFEQRQKEFWLRIFNITQWLLHWIALCVEYEALSISQYCGLNSIAWQCVLTLSFGLYHWCLFEEGTNNPVQCLWQPQCPNFWFELKRPTSFQKQELTRGLHVFHLGYSIRAVCLYSGTKCVKVQTISTLAAIGSALGFEFLLLMLSSHNAPSLFSPESTALFLDSGRIQLMHTELAALRPGGWELGRLVLHSLRTRNWVSERILPKPPHPLTTKPEPSSAWC